MVWKYLQVGILPYVIERNWWVIVIEADSWGWGLRGELKSSWVKVGTEEGHTTGGGAAEVQDPDQCFIIKRVGMRSWRTAKPSVWPPPLECTVTSRPEQGTKSSILKPLLLKMITIWDSDQLSLSEKHHHPSGNLGWHKIKGSFRLVLVWFQWSLQSSHPSWPCCVFRC